jgi:hypothetical protein
LVLRGSLTMPTVDGDYRRPLVFDDLAHDESSV